MKKFRKIHGERLGIPRWWHDHTVFYMMKNTLFWSLFVLADSFEELAAEMVKSTRGVIRWLHSFTTRTRK